ncbi:MAG: hypothetical protein F6K16_38685 [Symploca sp. SIO2B6]|nr:hypothetical protein [Symploca sp. SIO2B6]
MPVPPLVIALFVFMLFMLWKVWSNSGGGFQWGSSERIDPVLLKAVNGDRKAALRLLEQARFKYPGKSERWYREKVIYDLGRDHGVIKARGPRFNVNKREVRENLFLIGGILFVLNSCMRFINNLLGR